MNYQENQVASEELDRSLTVKQRWNNLHPWARRGIITAIILLILSIITMVVLIAVVLSWKPTCMVTQTTAYPVAGTNQEVVLKTATVTEKKLASQDIKFDAQVTSVKQATRLMQEEPAGSVPFPSIISFDNGRGVTTQAFTENDLVYFVDPDQVISTYTPGAAPSRLLQQEGITAADPNNNVLKFDDPTELRAQIEDSLLRAAAASMQVDLKDLIMTYEQTITATLKSDGSYQLEQIQQSSPRLLTSTIRELWKRPKLPNKPNLIKIAPIAIGVAVGAYTGNPSLGMATYGIFKNKLKSYAPDIASATGSDFSENVEIQVAVEIAPSRLLQEGNSSEQTDNSNIRHRSRPISYRSKGNGTSRVKILNEASFNCSYKCTGSKEKRTCTSDLFDKCGYKTGNRTGRERVRGRYIIKCHPEAAQEERERQQQVLQQEAQSKAAPTAPQAPSGSAVTAASSGSAIPETVNLNTNGN